jgi:benzoate membrane transport protein
MLAGVLLRFGLDLFKVAPQILAAWHLLLAFLLGRHSGPLYHGAGLAPACCSAPEGRAAAHTIHWQLASPVWTCQFSINALFGIACHCSSSP